MSLSPKLIMFVIISIQTVQTFMTNAASASRSRFLKMSKFQGLDGMPDPNKFLDDQWNLLIQHHTGNFVGIQTGYDPLDNAVADYMYTQVSLIPEGNVVTHSVSFVAQEIRSDCETCFDSERVKTKIVGQYSRGALKSRLCDCVELRGPGLTPRGLSTEVIIRLNSGRIRVLLAYSPYLDPNDLSNAIPVFKLTDYVVVRERLNKRPLNLDINPDPLWLSSPLSLFDGPFTGSRHYYELGLPVTEQLLNIEYPRVPEQRTKISSMEHEILTSDDHRNEDFSVDGVFRRLLPGGIRVEAPFYINDLEQKIARARVSWMPLRASEDFSNGVSTSESSSGMSVSAEIAFRAPLATLPDGRPVPPQLIEFFVDRLSPSTSA